MYFFYCEAQLKQFEVEIDESYRRTDVNGGKLMQLETWAREFKNDVEKMEHTLNS